MTSSSEERKPSASMGSATTGEAAIISDSSRSTLQMARGVRDLHELIEHRSYVCPALLVSKISHNINFRWTGSTVFVEGVLRPQCLGQISCRTPQMASQTSRGEREKHQSRASGVRPARLLRYSTLERGAFQSVPRVAGSCDLGSRRVPGFAQTAMCSIVGCRERDAFLDTS